MFWVDQNILELVVIGAKGFPGGSVAKNLPACRRYEFDAQIGKVL